LMLASALTRDWRLLALLEVPLGIERTLPDLMLNAFLNADERVVLPALLYDRGGMGGIEPLRRDALVKKTGLLLIGWPGMFARGARRKGLRIPRARLRTPRKRFMSAISLK